MTSIIDICCSVIEATKLQFLKNTDETKQFQMLWLLYYTDAQFTHIVLTCYDVNEAVAPCDFNMLVMMLSHSRQFLASAMPIMPNYIL